MGTADPREQVETAASHTGIAVNLSGDRSVSMFELPGEKTMLVFANAGRETCVVVSREALNALAYLIAQKVAL